MLTEEQVRQIAYEVVEQELGRPGTGLAAAWRVWEAIEALTIAQQRTEEEVRALAEAQRRTEERVEELAEAQRRTEERVEELAAAQCRTEERLARLEAAVQELVTIVQRHEERLASVEERLARLEATVQELVEIVRRHEERLASVEERLASVEERLASVEERVARLEDTVAKLAEAQRRTEQRLEELAEAQRRTEQRLEELAEAQRRTEQELKALAEAHYRLEEIVTQLIRRVDQMSLQLGQLSNRLGLDLEVDAEEVLLSLLEERGIQPLREPFAIEVDGEMDVVVPVELPTGERPWIIVEVKGRLRRKELGEFLQRLQRPWFQERLQKEGIQKPYLPYAFGLRVYADVDRMAMEAGVGILTFRGERVAPQLWE
jgi:DNA repair exonuclease SbcCD ATPase subunit